MNGTLELTIKHPTENIEAILELNTAEDALLISEILPRLQQENIHTLGHGQITADRPSGMEYLHVVGPLLADAIRTIDWENVRTGSDKKIATVILQDGSSIKIGDSFIDNREWSSSYTNSKRATKIVEKGDFLLVFNGYKLIAKIKDYAQLIYK